jgi:hypothetical protein
MGKVKEPCTFAFSNWNERLNYVYGDYDMDKTWRGEASTVYSETHIVPDIACQIHRYNPSSRIIYVVRNPINRILSVWAQSVTTGHHFKDVYAMKTDAMKVGYMPRDFHKAIWEYPVMMQACQYATHLKKYLDIFPKENIKLMFYEDLLQDPLLFYEEINNFLQAPPPDKKITDIWLNKREEKRIPLTPKLDKVSKFFAAEKVFKNHPKLRNKIKEIMYPGLELTQKIDNEEIYKIMKHLHEDIRYVLEYGGKTNNFWSVTSEV